jgi:hypothetical protein
MATVVVLVPPGVTARQLNAAASLLDAVTAERWGYLSEAFTRLANNGTAATWPAPTAELLGRLVLGLREAAEELEEARLVREP